MSADAIVKSFIDRVLRLKEEQDALSADIREVYAEAKGNGYDKTAMGEVVAYLRKIEKKGKDAVSERTAMFDLYLDAYERPSHTHTRARGFVATLTDEQKAAALAYRGDDTHGGEITDTQEQPEAVEQTSPAPTRKTAGSAPRNEGSEGANTEHDDVDGSTERAGHAGQPFDALTGQVETRTSEKIVERNTSGPDAKRATHSPETASQSEPASDIPSGADRFSGEYAGTSSDENPAPIPHSSDVLPVETDKAGEAVTSPAVSPVNLSDDDVPAFLRKSEAA